MREIKFRAWDKQDKRMIVDEQDFLPVAVTNKGILRLSPYHTENLWSIADGERFVLMQYTGLSDKNGKEIYEGDILKVPDLYETPENTSATYHNELIDFVECCFRLGGQPLCDDAEYVSDECEVIGNIHEHPNLLQEETK